MPDNAGAPSTTAVAQMPKAAAQPGAALSHSELRLSDFGSPRREDRSESPPVRFPKPSVLMYSSDAAHKVPALSRAAEKAPSRMATSAKAASSRAANAEKGSTSSRKTPAAQAVPTSTASRGKGSKSGANRREQGASDNEIEKLSDEAKASAELKPAKAKGLTQEEKHAVVAYVTDERRWPGLKVKRGEYWRSVSVASHYCCHRAYRDSYTPVVH